MMGGAITRREFLLASAAGAGLLLWPVGSPAAARALRARESSAKLVGPEYPPTAIWGYDGVVPGPELRYRQGERLRIEVENLLPADTTVHFHGIRLPNAMDGVPELTQPPIAARGGRFTYDFALPDAGTYWYHPHLASSEQLARGLCGALVVEDAEPPAVDRDVVWVLGDWRLDREARVVGNFANFMDASHAGRIGNTVTVNGRVPEAFPLRAGERLRLRLINAGNARIFALEFRGHDPVVIALDGHPVEPHRPAGGRIVLGPAMRADVLLDATGEPGRTYPVVDDFFAQRAYRLIDLRYAETSRASGSAGSEPPRLRPNALPEPDLGRAARHRFVFGGGMMGRVPMARMQRGAAWTVNDRPILEHDHHPILVLRHGQSVVLDLLNDTRWYHPIHLHGHVFRVLSRNGAASRYREWLDTVLLPPGESAEIAYVADNPGDWMFHCHVLEHQSSGMMAVVRVAP